MVYCDNSVAVYFSKNNKCSSKSKHIELKFDVVQERIQQQKVSMEHIKTDLILVDPLTKALAPKKFREHVSSMGLAIL